LKKAIPYLYLSISADRVVLRIAEKEMNQLQKNVKRLVAYGNEIRQCRDTRSFKKIIPLLEEEKDVHVVTADDDVCY
jgi:hypothetical protein